MMAETFTAALADKFLHYPDGRLDGMFDIEPRPRAWFARDRLLMGRGAALVGLGGTGKTRLLTALAAGGVLGRVPWGWEMGSTGAAALFLAENTVDDVHRAMFEAGQALASDERAALQARLRIFAMAGLPAQLLQLSEGGNLVPSLVYDWARERISRFSEHRLVFLGFDPALAMTEGDELSQTHQRRLGELVDHLAIQTGACVVLTAHAAKGIAGVEELGSHAARGGGALTDALRAEFVMRGMTADEGRRYGVTDPVERKRYLQLTATKGNELPPEAYAPQWLKRAGWSFEAASLEQIEAGTVGKRELAALDIFKRYETTGALSMKFLREQCVAENLIQPGSLPAQEKAAERIRDALVSEGFIKKGVRRGDYMLA